MRIDAVSLWRGECRPYLPGNFGVLLDGDIVEKILEADDVEGWVKFIENSNVVTKNGKVEFIPHWE